MAEKDLSRPCNNQKIRQQASVPFLWEVKPGIPKRDWKPEPVPAKAIPPPVKLVASVPFEWEEKPGKPLPCFSQSQSDSPLLLLPPPKLIGYPSPSSYSPSSSPTKINGTHCCTFQTSRNDAEDEGSEIGLDDQGVFGLDLHTSSFEADESFSSAVSLLANRLVPSIGIFNAVPVQQSSKDASCTPDKRTKHESSPSIASETDSNATYETGSSSFTGVSFMDCFFPLFSPDSGFLDKVGCPEKDSPPTSPIIGEPQTKKLDCESNCSRITRRPPTLGELILMSRRRSHRNRAVQIRKNSSPMVISQTLGFMNKSAFGCCFFGASANQSNGLQRWGRRQMLKFE